MVAAGGVAAAASGAVGLVVGWVYYSYLSISLSRSRWRSSDNNIDDVTTCCSITSMVVVVIGGGGGGGGVSCLLVLLLLLLLLRRRCRWRGCVLLVACFSSRWCSTTTTTTTTRTFSNNCYDTIDINNDPEPDRKIETLADQPHTHYCIIIVRCV